MRYFTGLANLPANLATVTLGIPQFFVPNPLAWLSAHTQLGVERAAYYSTSPLRETLADLVDLERIAGRHTRLTVGAVNVRNGEMRYFDSRDETVHLDHVLASGALPPAFPAVRIDGDPYWDGGIYSNTPIEAVLDDKPRQDSVIFTVHMWNPEGPEPDTLWQVMGRQKDIQFASRARSHIARQKQIHHLRHIIRELVEEAARHATRATDEARELASWGCGTTMHVVRLDRALDRRRGPHQGHRLHAERHSRALAGRLRRRQADAEARAVAASGRPDRGRRSSTTPRLQFTPKLAQGVDGFSGRTR